MAGSCSGPSSCFHHHHHHLPLSFSTSLTLIKVSSLSLSPSHFRAPCRCGCLPCFLVSQFPQIILPGGAVSSRSVAQHCHCPCCVPQSCPCSQETELYPNTAIHQLYPLDFWQSGANLDHGFPSLSCCRLPFSSHWKRHCKYISLHCLGFYFV